MGPLGLQKGLGVGNGGMDLQAVADNSRVLQKGLDLLWSIGRYLQGVKTVKGLPEILPFSKDGDPAQAGLKTFQGEKFEKAAILPQGNAPLQVMVGLVKGIPLAPRTSLFFHGFVLGVKIRTFGRGKTQVGEIPERDSGMENAKL